MIVHLVKLKPSQALLERLSSWEDLRMRSDHETRRAGADRYAELEGRVLGAVPGDMAGDVACSLRAVAHELRATGPGGIREAVSLQRVADALDHKRVLHELAQATEAEGLTMDLRPSDLGVLERLTVDLEQHRSDMR